ncbi:MAG: PIN domain nuclease, partial [Actinomycetota bacterium]|nr:PIN domain nuclease [Actinomycetota bacterium]
AKVVDTSALVDGRIVDVCRAGFIDSTLVVPQFVLYELQGLADAGDDERRAHGRRGLDVLGALQRSAGVALEVAEEDFPEIGAVDAKLVAMARQRGASLLTVDAHLGRVAEIRGVRVLNLHTLAETLRPPVLPGQRLRVRILKVGKEPGQGVGYLSDGTMVVMEGACDRRLAEVTGEVTSILSNPNGRMVFATLVDVPTSAPAAAESPSRILPPASTE